MNDDKKKRIEDALKELTFEDEAEVDFALLGIPNLPGCIKDCGGHCGGKTGGCPNQRYCEGKCLQRGACIKNCEVWCPHEGPECPPKGQICSPKCHIRN